MSAKEKATIFIVDDDASVRKSLSRLLDSLEFRTEAFASAEAFLKRGPYEGAGCIILDVRMPGLSGMDLQEELNKAEYAMPIIFITGHGDIPMSVKAMKSGAVDFLPKPFDEQELVNAIDKAIERDRTARVSRSETRHVLEQIAQLTPREHEVLQFLITGMLNKQIAFKLGIAEKTIKIHRARVLEKLGARSVAELVRIAEKAGIPTAK